MFIFLLIFFKVIPAKKIDALSIEKNKFIKEDKKDKYNCDTSFNNNHLFEESGEQDLSFYFKCGDQSQFSIQKCTFDRIVLYRHEKSWGITKEYESILLFFIRANIELLENNINECKVRTKIIYCEGDTDHELKMHSNNIKNCNYKNPSDKKKIEILSSFYKKNDIRYNTISFENLDATGRAFYINKHNGCKLIGNHVTNSNYQEQSSGVFFGGNGEGEELEFADNIFTNCDGNEEHKGNAVKIAKLTYNLVIKNTTFEYCVSERSGSSWGTKYYEGYLIGIETSMNPATLTFKGCTFQYLKCNGMNGGAIGLHFYNGDSTEYSLLFEDTKFEHLIFTNGNYGGGAISCSGNWDETKFTELTVRRCTFHNVSSAHGGGAIYFNTRGKNLIVEDSNFSLTYQNNEKGGAIFAQYYNEKNKNHIMDVTITGCNFENTHSNEGGSIYIEYENGGSNSHVTINGCHFTNSKANTNGHSIYITNSVSDVASINHCTFTDCGSDSKTYSLIFDINKLDFTNNEIIFTHPQQSCGCIELKKIGEHVFKGNTLKNAHNDNSIWNSAGINAGINTDLTSLLIENNTFDQINGNNQGRCIYIVSKGNHNVQVRNNTIKNCPPGGTLLKIWFQTEISSFKVESCTLINNSVSDYYDLIGPAPHMWFEHISEGEHIKPFELVLEKCHFEMNSNTDHGGGFHYGNIRYTANIKLVLKECHFINNKANKGAGALSIHIYQECEILNCEFIRNRSEQGSGSIYIETDFECLKNDEKNPTAVIPIPSPRNPSISIVGSYFEDNTGKGSHAINVKNSNNVPISISLCNFVNCGTNDYVVSIETDVPNSNIQNCTFNFTTDQTSSGIYNIHDKLTLIGNSFISFKNTVIRFPCTQTEQSFHLIENKFINCQNCHTFYVENTLSYSPEIRGNHFDFISGNGQLCYIKLNDNINSFTFDNNSFTNFNMDSDYGGISLDISHENKNNELSFIFNDCVFINNTNTKFGGAISFDSYQNDRNVILTLSRCYFIKNHNENKGSSVYLNIKNAIFIDECHFSENSGAVNGIIYIEQNYESSTVSTIRITNCHFQENKGKDSSIYLATGILRTLKIESCSFVQDYGGIYVDDFNNEIDIQYNSFTKTTEKPALTVNSPTKTANIITVKFCIFDACNGLNNQCFDIIVNTKSFTFMNNVLQNNIGNRYDSYFGSLDCSDEIITFEISNITFINNVCKSLYGGGTGLQLKRIQQITIDECNFINNVAQQDTSMSRPTIGSDKYYNGDGGGFQIGYICTLNEINLILQDCKFINNSAFRHGGALSIQTIGFVKITRCIFENNKANCNSLSSELLVENHFNKKSEGRGGAIYINPSYTYEDSSCRPPGHFMSSVEITKCEFYNNNGYDGYGMYIEGDDPGSTFTMSIYDNVFTDNYNENNHNDDKYSIYGAVITTEINKITEEQASKDNNFNYSIAEIKLHNVSFVNHYGKTPSKEFTLSDQFTESDHFPSNSFTNSQAFSQSLKFSESNDFSASSDFTASRIKTKPPSQEFTASEEFSFSQFFTKSDKFTSSSKFSKTESFSNSNQFTKSDKFSKSNPFSQSNNFLPSKQFTQSGVFSNTNQFSSSYYFSKSDDFSSSNKFTRSNMFSNSDKFSSTNQFSKTDYFSNSKQFSNSDQFSSSNIFSKSNYFSKSGQFTQSNQFSETKQFTKSNVFSNTNQFSSSYYFSKSGQFSNSDKFTKSNLFSNSDKFSSSNQFSETKYFSNSNKFTNSDQFSNSNKFSKSDYFSKSGQFTQSNQFSETKQFTKSSAFSNTNQFSSSYYFSKSGQFSNSDKFTKSDLFSSSNLFSLTNEFSSSSKFSSSDQFSRSGLFSTSGQFTKSNLFTNSEHFSSTNQFTKSDLFSNSHKFSESDLFTVSKQFSESNQFTESNKFTKSNMFSNTNQFSSSNYFTKTDMFSNSDKFTQSYLFSSSSKFSNSNMFSNSKAFTSTKQFTKTESFTYSSQFSKTNEFSDSNLFSNSNKFSKSNQFSGSFYFSKSKPFSSTDLFSHTNDFTESNNFSNSKPFSQSSAFSKSVPFSSSNLFTKSEIFSKTNQFSKTDLFTESKDFTNSNKFSDSTYFSQSKGFTKSNLFSRTDQFSQTNLFSKTNHFSQSGLFSQTNDFTDSRKFSESQQFSHSAKFSNTNHFSLTDQFSLTSKFTHSLKFSESGMFTKSNDFTRSETFSKSSKFTKTNDFSNTNLFSKTNLFSESTDFSHSKQFSYSYFFSKTEHFSATNEFSNTNSFSFSNDFSSSNKFSESNEFTKTNDFTNSKSFSFSKDFSSSESFTKSSGFSESNKFTESSKFSHSNGFSESIAFTMSEPYEIKEPKCILYEDGEEILLNHCNFSMMENKNVLIRVISTNFTHMKYDNINGTAIHVDNCGLECNRTLFDDCITSRGCGGAIYIRNTLNAYNNITFEDLIFINCKAICGGAVFIYSEREDSEILIRNCTFKSNEAYRNRNSNNFNLFGGCALYVCSPDANIIDCSFKENFGRGGCVKIESFVNNKNARQLDLNPNPIRISGCSFDNTKKSESSIFYDNDDNRIEITDCNFKGKIKNGFNYIDGKTKDKDKLQIKNCLFEYESHISNKAEINKHSNKYMTTKFSLNWSKVSICAFAFISAFILIVIKYGKNLYNNKFNLDYLLNQMIDNNQENLIMNDL